MSQNWPLLGIAASVTLGAAAVPRPRRRRRPRPPRGLRDGAARRTGLSAALLALSALSDSALEHYRGSFHNKAMYAPLVGSALILAASLRDARAPASGGDDDFGAAIDTAAIATGAAGTAFHIYNVGKRPGQLSWLNLFYGAPLGAPATLSLAGLLRRIAALIRRNGDGPFGLSAGRVLAGTASAGLLGTSAEAALMHFRGAYQDRAMFLPVTVGPLAACSLAWAAARPERRHPLARWLLRALVGIGCLGAGFHANGISRNMAAGATGRRIC